MQRKPGFSVLLKSCLIITALVIGLFTAGIIYVLRTPGMRPYATCKTVNMQQIAAAIERYEDVNGHRPPNLEALKKDYMEDPSVLRCPLDKTSGNAPSYTYNPDASSKEVMLECDRHTIQKGVINKLSIAGDGSDVSFREMLKDAKREAKRKQNGDL